ncbi:hypothetical protein WJX72_009368 [[Myrmecia] bisecta]|uniref:cellulase n=1 Tax=[Myrmecia] bisecta TaxID=41462 RepID=A0AAW1P2V2_9CHLO
MGDKDYAPRSYEPKDYDASSSDLYSEASTTEHKEHDPAGDNCSGSDEAVAKIRRTPSDIDLKGAGRRDALGILLRLAEVLEREDGAPPVDYYGDDVDSQLLGKPGKEVNFDLLNSYDSHNLKHGRSAGLLSTEDEDEDEVYCATAFNAPDVENMARNPVFGAAAVERGPEGEDAADRPKFEKKFKRQTKINWRGCFMVFIFLVTLCFYLWVRITKTLDLGKYLPYGIFILVVEMMGATTTLLYGVNLLLDPVNPPLPEDPARPGIPLVGLPYHVRVLIPCYKEGTELVRKTIQGAFDAVLPANCCRTIYLSDDGKDPTKRHMCREFGPDVVYVSGRQRAPGEVNGKSGNLNNCLSQIYPEGVPVPPNELVCIFDADQVANSDFYAKTVPLFDGGDDVGMVLSPQAFHNLRIHADIFNHANIHFWEYAQHGYDALGFISCTGTNFLTRASAFQEAGWSPTYTLTEDYALGMELKKGGWQCRYVEEYLAIGEAPEQVRNCFQQRSRWCKGHFQMVLSREHCPLFQRKLSLGMKILYCSGVWSYIVGAITTPTFILIPLLTIWAGVFPITVSWWAALALTVYTVAQTLVLNYMKKWKHIEALWFANIANQILWFTFVKACWRAMNSVCGKTITFKTTLKGASKLMDSALGDLWMPITCLLALTVSLGIGLQKLINGPAVITTLAISVVWIIYAMIPPYLVIHYTWIGRGGSLQLMCRFTFVLSYLAGILALLLLWAVYPRQYDFGAAAGDSLKYYDAMRVGALPADNRIPWRHDSLLYEAARSQGFNDLTGGWTNGGVLGNVKLTMPAAFTTSMLAWGVLAFSNGYQSSQQMDWAKESVRWGADYLLKTYKPLAANASSTVKDFEILYQVGNLTTDSEFWGPPEAMNSTNMPRPAYNVSTANGASDLAGQMVAAFAATALVFKDSDSAYHDKLMSAALELYGAATKTQAKYTRRFLYDCTSKFAKSRIGISAPASPCPPPTAFNRGSALVFYNSTSYRDDLLWAAAWMYKASGDQGYLADVNQFYGDHIDQEGDQDSFLITDWDHVFWASNVLLAQLTDQGAFHMATQNFLKQWICGAGNYVVYTPRGRAWNPNAPSLGATANAAFLSLAYAQISSKSISQAKSERYTCWARGQMRYVLGDSGRSLVAGWGKKAPQHVQNKAASCASTDGSCNKLNALFSPQPNPHVLTGALVEMASFSDSFQDMRTNNDTRVTIDYNAGFTGVLAGLHSASGTWAQCLQGVGVLTKDKAVCDSNL